MKHVFFSFLCLIAFMNSSNGQSLASVSEGKSGAQITFESLTVDYGKISKGSEPIRKFTFVNTGDEPLLITSAKASCGCTVPTYPKEAILPGKSATLDVRYDTNRVGMINKSISVTTNAGETIALKITGEVVEAK